MRISSLVPCLAAMLSSICTAGIRPTAVEINLSAFPVDRYFDMNVNGSSPLINGCATNITVRQCVQQLFSTGTNNWRSQGVTGVRFFFTLAGGHFSTPFDSAGNVRTQWSDNLYWFFYDLKGFGILKVTPTPVFDSWSGPSNMMQSRYVSTCGTWKTLNFVPWLPYGLDPSDSNYPERTCQNNSYFSAAQTPSDIFWGWTRFFNLMDTVLIKAQATGLIVDALDYFQETNFSFTVYARMIYDNYRGVNVLQALRDRMTWRGFSAGRISPSANHATPTVGAFDCGSYYGDSAMLLPLSELAASFAGAYGKFGDPPYSAQYGLACFSSYDDSANPMISLPTSYSQPTFIDIHSQAVYRTAPFPSGVEDLSATAARAKNFYSGVWSFMQYRGRTNDYVVFGETNPVDNVGCSEWTATQADAMLNGVSGQYNGYKNSTLFANRASSVVMRPWHRTEYGFSCTPSPNRINPPFDPFNY